MYKASIQDKLFEIEVGDKTLLDGKLCEIEFSQSAKRSFILSMNGKRKEADVVKFDKEAKQLILRMEGKKITVDIKEPVDILLDQLGINQKVSRKVNNLKAPMPGLIVKVMAAIGDQLKAGEPLLILEAMKMENVFKASADVMIKDILVSEKQSVEKGQVLIVFE
ncbi:MAG: acetyl-CoA carboxylase biotin carboxyl carrier protein subunit [Bacteroidetes bacterium]|nr:acetyl-CoA carboxylase biotin carboxyl carrier protein subunit [Bacteroidota bacterium]